ncbi:MAG TPA: beta-N-acetylhexosaminidase [Bacillales bacterium]|nr:beta-N-acetylhexosaminidase [Bacillales bacterium]
MMVISAAALFCSFAPASSFQDKQPQWPMNDSPIASAKGIQVSLPPQHQQKPIQAIMAMAAEGRLYGTHFQLGETTSETLIKQFGPPDRKAETASGIYFEWHHENISAGMNHGKQILDLRSSRAIVQNITLEALKTELGKPDAVHFFKTAKVDQVIWIYNENLYQIKWIFPRPTKAAMNPVADHISVTYQPGKQWQAKSIDDRLKTMSVKEKIGQMIIAGIDGTSLTETSKTFLQRDHIGGVIFYQKNLVSPRQAVRFLNEIKAQTASTDVPLLFGIDQEGGRVSKLPKPFRRIPSARVIGNKNDPAYAEKIGRALALEVKSVGLNLNFAPVLDINSNPRNPVIGDRAFGTSEAVVSRIGIPVMKGIQSEGILAVVKHFPGHGDTNIDSHTGLPVVHYDLKHLLNVEIQPFAKAIKEGADMVMVAHISFPKIDPNAPASLSKTFVTDVLRNRLGFDHVIMTDDLTMGAITNKQDIGSAAVKAVKAGNDLLLIAHGQNNVDRAIEAVEKAVKQGDIPVSRLDASVRRILELKINYHLSSQPTRYPNVKEINQQIDRWLND